MKNNNNTPDTTEADVGHEKTLPKQDIDPETWENKGGSKQIGWADEVRVMSNYRIMT